MKWGQSLRVLGLAIVLGSTCWAQVTQRVSIASNGTQGNGESAYPSLSADGRYVGFRCAADREIT